MKVRHYEGECYSLKDEHKFVIAKVLEAYSYGHYTLEEECNAFKISYSKVYRWIEHDRELATMYASYRRTRNKNKAILAKDLASDSVQILIREHETETTTIFFEFDQHGNKVYKHGRSTIVKHAPNATLVKLVLQHADTDGLNLNQKVKNNLTFEEELDLEFPATKQGTKNYPNPYADDWKDTTPYSGNSANFIDNPPVETSVEGQEKTVVDKEEEIILTEGEKRARLGTLREAEEIEDCIELYNFYQYNWNLTPVTKLLQEKARRDAGKSGNPGTQTRENGPESEG